MALVTVQRSPSAGSPQCSNSDGEAEDEENSKNDKSECFFAGKGTALVLALKEIPPNAAERRLSTDSTRSTNSTQSNSSDIQLHLQSMFNLLRHEETLKMAVKLESQRPNRTRYLVIASRCCYRAATTERRSKISRHNSSKSQANSEAVAAAAVAVASLTAAVATVTATAITATTNAISNNMPPISQRHSLNLADTQTLSSNSKSQMDAADSSVGSVMDASEKRLSTISNCSSSNRQSVKCDVEKNCASGDGKNIEGIEGIEESCLLGIDCNERTTIGLVVPILADTNIHLDGDGGFSVTVFGKTHIFKPVSVQAMWSALQTLHKVSQKARENNFYPGGPSHDWLSYYESRIESDQSCLNEWNAMDSLESRRPPSPDAIRNKPTAKEETKNVIKMKLKEIMMSVDLDEVTSKYIRGHLEEHLDMDLDEYKSFIDAEMLTILGQMDAPTEIFEHVYLGSEWNASNLEELQKNGVRHILNVTREIDNFFPGMFDYFNVRVYDDEKTNLLKYWDNTYRYITRAKAEGSKVLVHCKMGVSRSASVVIAYAMKEYNWEFQQALQHVKGKRNCIKPNKNFLNQLETYRGMLDAMKNKEKLQRSKSETNLKSTKDARLLPGSEPTPLIQALNHSSKCKSVGQSVSDAAAGADAAAAETAEMSLGNATVRGLRASANSNHNCDHKQRRAMRRSSSISPKATQTHASAAIVLKQQSQSMENLTPERSVADEPRNVRFPGNNGENYSVTPNQVLHIQKNTPPPPAPPPLPATATMTNNNNATALALAAALQQAHTVKNIVQDLETQRRSLNLQISRSTSQDAATATVDAQVDAAEANNSSNSSVKSLCSPVWTSSTKLITQTTNIAQRLDEHGVAQTVVSPSPLRALTARSRHDTSGSATSDSNDAYAIQLDNQTTAAMHEQEKRHRRKTQSWAANSSSGGIVLDASTNALAVGSNSSLDSATSIYESNVRNRTRRDLPSRHASWGSGDTRCQTNSWTAYDSNRNASTMAPPAAIVEGQIHELNTSYKTASTDAVGTVKRTKQKLQECTALKKLCQENATAAEEQQIHAAKRISSLHRSASAAGATHARYPQRCNSDEIVPIDGGTAGGMLQRATGIRRSDGNRPLKAIEALSVSAPEAYTMSDIENKNTMPTATTTTTHIAEDDNDEIAAVVLRTGLAATMEEQRISGNVQILKKNFEAKAQVGTAAVGAQTQNANTTTIAGNKKGHQSLPSSPVAQHAEHASGNGSSIAAETAAIKLPVIGIGNSSCSSTSSTGSSSSTSGSDVKGLVHKYQTTTSVSTATAAATAATTMAMATHSNCVSSQLKPRPRSCYENASSNAANRQIRTYNKQLSQPMQQQQQQQQQQHDYSDSRPPPVPVKHNYALATANSTSNHPHATHLTMQTAADTLHQHAHTHTHVHPQQQQQRRLQQHGKTHPLARLSLGKTFTAAAYNTM